MATNRKLGNTFEAEFCEALYAEGFWVHNMAQNQAGQPADVIAVRNGKAYLIDCKVCSNGKFALDRVEENQRGAMNLWDDCGNGKGWFALKLNDSVLMLSYYAVDSLSRTRSVLNATDLYYYGEPLERWVQKCK